MANKTDPWEQVRHLTLDQLITRVKLAGSNFELNGYTTPENYAFRFMLAIGKPGNQLAIELMKKLHDEFTERTRSMQADANPNLKRPEASALADAMRAQLDLWYSGKATRAEVESFIRFGNLTEEQAQKLGLTTMFGGTTA